VAGQAATVAVALVVVEVDALPGLVRVGRGADDDATRTQQRADVRQERAGRLPAAEQADVVAKQQGAVEAAGHAVGGGLAGTAEVDVTNAALATGLRRSGRGVKRGHRRGALLQHERGAPGPRPHVNDPASQPADRPLVAIVPGAQVRDAVNGDEAVVPLHDERLMPPG
jgi:hypothetical protein